MRNLNLWRLFVDSFKDLSGFMKHINEIVKLLIDWKIEQYLKVKP